MADFLSLEVLGDREALRNIDRMPDTVRAILAEKSDVWVKLLEQHVQDYIAPHSKSGRLLAGVRSEVIAEDKRLRARVFISGVPYANIQDKGGVTPAHMILPRGKVLAFLGATGDKVFATKVLHPGGNIPALNFMKEAYREVGPLISRGVKKSIVDGIRANMRSS